MMIASTLQAAGMPRVRLSASVDGRVRTADVRAASSARFSDVGVSPWLQGALRAAAFQRPSPVQAAALPHALAGEDVVVQAKAGTGKTLVFVLAALELLAGRTTQRRQRAGAADQERARAPAGEAGTAAGDAHAPQQPGGAPGAGGTSSAHVPDVKAAAGSAGNASSAAVGAPAAPTVLVLCPTRELALQTLSVFRALAAHSEEVEAGGEGVPRMRALVGGVPLSEDLEAARAGLDVVVGSPGRVAQLLGAGAIDAKHVQLLVLDEADALVGSKDSKKTDSMVAHTRVCVAACPPAQGRQTLALSATFGAPLLARVEALMRPRPRPSRVLLCGEQAARALEGVRQYYVAADAAAGGACEGSGGRAALGDTATQLAAVAAVLRAVPFHQAVVFARRCNTATALAQRLCAAGVSAGLVTGQMSQRKRTATMARMRELSLRVLVSTDLLARGVDLEHVNLVISLGALEEASRRAAAGASSAEAAEAAAGLATVEAAAVFEQGGASTYMHRLGRAGRFGTLGVAVTVVRKADVLELKALHAAAGGVIEPLPEMLEDASHAEYTLAEGARGAAAQAFGTRIAGRQAQALESEVTGAAAAVARSAQALHDASAGDAEAADDDVAAERKDGLDADYGNEEMSLAQLCASGAMRELLELEVLGGGDGSAKEGGDCRVDLVEIDEGGFGAGEPQGSKSVSDILAAMDGEPSMAVEDAESPEFIDELRSVPTQLGEDVSLSEVLEAFFECGWADGRLAAVNSVEMI